MASTRPLRSSASDRAWRTRTSPSGPFRLLTMNASVYQPGPYVTDTALLDSNWSSVVSDCVYDPLMPPVSNADVREASFGAPLMLISFTRGLTLECQEVWLG